MPSLHTAFAVLTRLVLLPVARRAWQQAALGYAVVMPLVLVWAGEHYVADSCSVPRTPLSSCWR